MKEFIWEVHKMSIMDEKTKFASKKKNNLIIHSGVCGRFLKKWSKDSGTHRNDASRQL